jgi:hypothetical protein
MPEFKTFSLADTIQTAEAIKGMRRQAESDKLRDAYMGQRMQADAAQEQRAQQTHESQIIAEQAKQGSLVVDAALQAPDIKAAIQQNAPQMAAQYEQKNGPGSFAQADPKLLAQELSQARDFLASKAGVFVNGTPEQRFAAGQQDKSAAAASERQFSNNERLAAIQHKYDLQKIDRQGAIDLQKREAAGARGQFKDQMSLRKEFEDDETVKNYRAVLPLYERAKNAPNTRKDVRPN